MSILTELLNRIKFQLNRRQFEQDLDEEMRHHLSMLAEDSRAPKQFGNITLLKEDSRAMWTFPLSEQLAQDVRYALRMMARNPLFTAMATLSLALGIGANTAIYSFMDALLLRMLPVAHPEELVVLKWRAKETPAVVHRTFGSRYRDEQRGMVSPNLPYAEFELLRTLPQSAVSGVFGYATGPQLNLILGDQAEVADGLFVSGDFYNSLGLSPAAGRLLAAGDDRSGAAPVAVISYSYWQNHFALSPQAVGQTILVNNIPVTIAGVSRADFHGVDPDMDPKIFLPMHSEPLFAKAPAEEEKGRFYDPNFYWVEIMGRLRPGVSRQSAEAQLAAQFHGFAQSTASTDQERTSVPALWIDEGSTGVDSLRRQYSKPLYMLMAMVGLILVIACANIANLLLARATARRREIAVRLSLGAGRLRIIRQLLTESVMLAALGGVMGLLVAYWGIQGITWLLSSGREDFQLHATLDWRVLAFTMGLSLLTGIVFGLAPAIQATGVDLTPSLKESRLGGNPRAGVFHRYFGTNRILVVAQIAISLVLVIGAGLFVRTLANLNSVDLGFERDNILVFQLNARQGGYKDADAAHFYTNLRARLANLPGVQSASISSFALASRNWIGTRLVIPGAPPLPGGKARSTAMLGIDPNFLATMKIPVVLGRGIEERDMSTARVAVVTEKFAEKFFGHENPIGRRIGIGTPAKGQTEFDDIEIIGIAKTTHYNTVKEEEIPPVAYVPFTQDLPSLAKMSLELRTSGDPLSLIQSVRQIVKQASPNVPITRVSSQSAVIDETISQERTFADLCSGLAALALAIACVGLYGTMAYSVARRTGEIGIRMALGAQRGGVVWMVLREVLVLAAVGLIIGLAGAWESTRFIKSFLFGMKPNDPLAISLSVAVLALAALIAGYAPARRASRIDPLTALRHE